MTSLVITPATDSIEVFINEGLPSSVTETSTSTLTNKTIAFSDNTLLGVQPLLESGVSIKTLNGQPILGDGDIAVLSTDVNNEAIENIKTITFSTTPLLTSTSGAISVDWSSAQNIKQSMPTGGITYAFSPPPGPCHLQLQIDNNGSGPAQTIVWPASVKWLLFVWTGVTGKSAIINFWYDGTNYWAMGSNAV